MPKIIVPTDFSACSEYALEVAAQIARKSDASEIHLVHFYERPVSGYVLQIEVDNQALNKLREHIETELHTLSHKPYMKDIHVIWHHIPDRDVIELTELEFAKDADLIVMGSHGIQDGPKWLLGSHTHKMVYSANTPVLVVKNRYPSFEVKNLVFASNFYSEADASFAKIKKIAQLFNSNIHLLRVNTRDNFEPTHASMALMDGFATTVGLKTHTKSVYNEDTVEDGVLRFAYEIGADLVAMETHKRTGIARVITHGITGEVLEDTQIPLLSVRIEEPQPVGK